MNGLPDLASLFDYDDPVGSEARFVELARQSEVPENPAYQCELLTRLARTRGLQRRFEEAHGTIEEARAIDCDSATCLVRISLESGRIFNSSGDKESASPLFREAFVMATIADLDELAVDAAHMLAIVESGDEALQWNEKAIEIAEASSDPKAKAWFGSLYNNTAWTHHGKGNYDRAYELFLKAKEYRIAQNQPKQVDIAEWCVGRCLRSMERLEEALALQTNLYAKGDESGYGAEELGELHLTLGDKAQSQKYFAEAYGKLSQDPWLQANEADRLSRLETLATDH